jgi:hypothetical protein
MALNLSTLTSPATSGDVLAEALTTADFLEPCPLLKNLARGSNKGGNAEQAVALNQPKALPLIDGKGYLYCSRVSGNYVSVPDAANLDGFGDFTLQVDVALSDWTPSAQNHLLSKYGSGAGILGYQLYANPNGKISLIVSFDGNTVIVLSSDFHGFTDNQRVTLRARREGTTLYFEADEGIGFYEISNTPISASPLWSNEKPILISGWHPTVGQIDGRLNGVKIWNTATPDVSDPVLDIDFTATNVRHGDTKFKCATGQVVTINQSGNDPATIIRKPVLRLDGVDDWYSGLFDSAIAGGRMFAAFTVLGNGGELNGRVFSATALGDNDTTTTGAIWLYNNSGDSSTYFEGDSKLIRNSGFSGAHIHEVLLNESAHKHLLDGGSELTDSTPLSIAPVEFAIGSKKTGVNSTAIDLEYLALFPATISDAQADAVRNFINNRNNVFDLKDGFGYYFYNPQDLSSGAVASWNGRIVGSENGDTDKFATQGTANDQPVGDGYVVTFADNTDHLDIPSTTQVGWQIVGTSLGTFAYRVNNTAVTELNLLGNLGSATYRQAGDLYGAILLPESATGADIQKARKLLIDRGAADASTIINAGAAWFRRYDIVEFKNAEFPDALTLGFAFEEATNLSKISTVNAPISSNFSSAWKSCSALTSFPAGSKLGTEASNVNFTSAWNGCTSLTSFPLIDTSSGTNFYQTWRNCTSLTSFPLINTSSGTSFYQAWNNCTSLTSFPLIDTSSGVNFNNAWYSCTSLTSFPLIDTSSGTYFSSAWVNCTSLTSFPLINTSSGTSFGSAWFNCNSLTSFPLIDTSSGTSFSYAWYNCTSLTSFPAGFFDSWNPSSISSGVFNVAWVGCISLTAQSVENILTSIDASGKYATTTGASGGTALADAGIDIDYNGDTLSAATTSAITSLKSKGWSIIVNGTTL